MLKKQTTMTMSGPVLSGAISSATATGYLPQYRGSAAASLAPTMMNASGAEREFEQPASNPGLPKEFMDSSAQLSPANFLPENRPLGISERSTRPSPERLNAEGYMRYISQRAEDDKKGGTGPVMGSDW